MFLRNLVLVSIVALAACVPSSIPERAHIQQQTELRPLLTLVTGDPDMRATYAQCPAQNFKTNVTSMANVKDTEKGFSKRFAACKAGSQEACFELARDIEKSDIDPHSNYTYPLFSFSCKAGLANGCVNAAATVKNGSWLADEPAVPASAECQFKTYKSACDENAYWGCRMVAGEYTRTDGFVPQNLTKAKAANEKAAALR